MMVTVVGFGLAGIVTTVLVHGVLQLQHSGALNVVNQSLLCNMVPLSTNNNMYMLLQQLEPHNEKKEIKDNCRFV